MTPRIKTQVDGYAKIEPRARHRLFMHPDEKKNASIEFDVKGLTSLDLAPYMEDFSSTDCAGNPEAGRVRLTWFLDGKKKGDLKVDESYGGTVNVALANSSRLKLEVDKENAYVWCDWFSVGFLNVK